MLPRFVSACLICSALLLLDSNGRAQITITPPDDYVRRYLLWSRLKFDLKALGDRLEVSGKERVTLTGNLTRSTGLATVVVTWELPGKLRIDETSLGALRTLTFDGTQARVSTGGSLTAQDRQLLETWLSDSAERFFFSQMQGMATRFLGERFRMDNGRTPGYTGPFYDIYELTDRFVPPGVEAKPRFFYFNSDTGFLDRVRYEIGPATARSRIEVLITWRLQDGQAFPSRISRSENNQAVLTLEFAGTAVVGPRVADGIFSNLQGTVTEQEQAQ